MTTNLPPSLTSLKLSPMFSMRLDVRDVQRIGGQAAAQVGVVAEGSFEGDRMSGKVLAGGSDWQSVRPDGSVRLD